MDSNLARVDIDDNPELLRAVEAADRANTPFILRSDGRDVARVVPLKTARRRSPRDLTPDERRDALLAVAGAWKDVDTDRFLTDNAASRRLSRPPISLDE